MIPVQRNLHGLLLGLASRHPTVTLTGPRQSGKTTLCRDAFASHAYVNLELPDERAFARSDPRGFLDRFSDGAILDEVQYVPDLLSYIQDRVDRSERKGQWILTGSQNLALTAGVSQSLAGRTAVVQLLPLALDEARRFPLPPEGLLRTMWTGGYPRIHKDSLPVGEWLQGYLATYVERDVRQLLNVGDLATFQTFLGLCAGRAGQLLNLASLGADCGITSHTARAWLTVLEASFIVFRLQPFHANLGKRLTKTPKLYFYDSGLLCALLGIREPESLRTHPTRGGVFESWAVSEVLKSRVHRGQLGGLHFYRDHRGDEVDLVLESEQTVVAVEMKSGQTVAEDFFAGLRKFQKALAPTGRQVEPIVVYGGEQSYERSGTRVLGWSELADVDWTVPERR